MELKILEQKENPIFNRKEILSEIEMNLVPSRESAKKLISEKFSAPVENIEIRKISGKFGSHIFSINAFLYASEEERKQLEKVKGKKKTTQ
jgi:ribosomal protein S24E